MKKVKEAGEELEFAGKQNKNSIRILETQLGIKLPASYVEFLEQYGAGGIVGAWISGICDNDPLKTDYGFVYGDTLRTRIDFNLDTHFIVIFRDEIDLIWCLDTRHLDENGEYPVVSIDVYNGNMVEKTANSFGDFFEEYLFEFSKS